MFRCGILGNNFLRIQDMDITFCGLLSSAGGLKVDKKLNWTLGIVYI